MPRRCLVVVITLALGICVSRPAVGQQRVVKAHRFEHRCGDDDGRPLVCSSYGNATNLTRGYHSKHDANRAAEAMLSNDGLAFWVYTAAETEAKIAASVGQIAQSTNEQLAATEARLKAEVKESIDKIPQRLLSDEAKAVLKDAVLAELRQELAQLRLELQRQIDELTPTRKAKPRQ